MIIELMDGTAIENVKQVYGGIKIINGIPRDTLKIELDGSTNLQELKSIFENNPNIMKLYTYNTIINDDKTTKYEKVLMGEGYNIFISAENINKKIPHKTGRLLPDKMENINVIMLAQMTYEEFEQTKGR